VEWKLVEMPLPRLQRIGDVTEEFIYSIHWGEGIRRRVLQEYWAGRPGFDNRILLKPGVGGFLRDLHGLLRPLIHRRWAAMVAALNQLPEAQLEAFLFGQDRSARRPSGRPSGRFRSGAVSTAAAGSASP
jgi:hypothetical protein